MSLLNGLLFYWSLEETAAGGSYASFGGKNCTLGTNTAGLASRVGVGRDFETASSSVLATGTNVTVVGDSAWTVQAWIKLESVGADRGIVEKWGVADPNRVFELMYLHSATQFSFKVSPDGTAAAAVSVEDSELGTPSTAVWYLVHAWHDPIADVLGIATNGAVGVTAAHTTGISTAASTNMNLGSTGAGDSMDGVLDEIAVWRRVLSRNERQQLYNGGNGLPFYSFYQSRLSPSLVLSL